MAPPCYSILHCADSLDATLGENSYQFSGSSPCLFREGCQRCKAGLEPRETFVADYPAFSRTVCVNLVLKEAEIAPMRDALVLPACHSADFLDSESGATESFVQDGLHGSLIEFEVGKLC